MRVRITKTPPASYGIDGESLMIGRVYNLASELASALLLEGCAEVYDAASDTRESYGGFTIWRANEPRRRKRDQRDPSKS